MSVAAAASSIYDLQKRRSGFGGQTGKERGKFQPFVTDHSVAAFFGFR